MCCNALTSIVRTPHYRGYISGVQGDPVGKRVRAIWTCACAAERSSYEMLPLFSSVQWENPQGARFGTGTVFITCIPGFRKLRKLAPALAEIKTETRFAIGWPTQG